MATNDIKSIGQESLSLAESLLNKKAEGVISVTKEDKNWRVVVEVLERVSVPDTQDILGRYEFTLDGKGELLDYKQIMLRRRADLVVEEGG